MSSCKLSHQITICKTIETLDQHQCIDAMRFIGDECVLEIVLIVKRLLMKNIMTTHDIFTIQSLSNIKKRIETIVQKKRCHSSMIIKVRSKINLSNLMCDL